MLTKTCSHCKKDLPKNEFHKNKSCADGLSNSCRKCQNFSNRKSYVKHLEKRLAAYKHYDRNVKAKSGLTTEEWDAKYYKQRGRCAICGKHQSQEGKRLAVDHDHVTGKIRGLLCMCCNTKLGWLENNFSSVVHYFKKNI